MQYYERLMKKRDYKSSESDGNNGPEQLAIPRVNYANQFASGNENVINPSLLQLPNFLRTKPAL